MRRTAIGTGRTGIHLRWFHGQDWEYGVRGVRNLEMCVYFEWDGALNIDISFFSILTGCWETLAKSNSTESLKYGKYYQLPGYRNILDLHYSNHHNLEHDCQAHEQSRRSKYNPPTRFRSIANMAHTPLQSTFINSNLTLHPGQSSKDLSVSLEFSIYSIQEDPWN